MRQRRSSAQVNEELKQFCLKPRFIQEILMKVNLNYFQFKKRVDLGIIKKIGEEKRDWTGPTAHVYQTPDAENILKQSRKVVK